MQSAAPSRHGLLSFLSPKAKSFLKILIMTPIVVAATLATMAMVYQCVALAGILFFPKANIASALLWGFGGFGMFSALSLGLTQWFYGKNVLPNSELAKGASYYLFVAGSTLAFFTPLQYGYSLSATFWATGLFTGAWWITHETAVLLLKQPIEKIRRYKKPEQEVVAVDQPSLSPEVPGQSLEQAPAPQQQKSSGAIVHAFDKSRQEADAGLHEAQVEELSEEAKRIRNVSTVPNK